MDNKRFLCYQQLVNEEVMVSSANTIGISVIIRNIGAKTKEEALGKFILNTSDILATHKLDPICIELDELLCID